MFVRSEDVAVGAGARVGTESVATPLRAGVIRVALVDVHAQIAVGWVHFVARIAGALVADFLLHALVSAQNFRLHAVLDICEHLI